VRSRWAFGGTIVASIGTFNTAYRTFAQNPYNSGDDAPAAQKVDVPAGIFQQQAAPPRTHEQVISDQQNNGVWINPQSMHLLLTGQEMMNMTRGDVRDLVAARQAGTTPYPKIELSEEGQRFTAAATEVQGKIRNILSAQGKDPGDNFTFGMSDGEPRLEIDRGKGTEWINAPTKEIGDLIRNLWATRTVDTTTPTATDRAS
jgi:hypothetical protein